MSGQAYTAGAISPRRFTAPPGRRSPTAALGIAALCAIGLALVWIVAELTPAGQLRDSILLNHFVLLNRPHVAGLANALLGVLAPAPFICFGVILVVIALVRRRARVALAVALVMALAPLTAETLKPLLAHPHLQIGATYIAPASWPSGHSTAALALVLCAALVAPVRLRPLVLGVGIVFAAAVGCSLLILAWHMPSDVVGGYLVASLWMALAVAALRATDRRRPATPRMS